jgi:hypothetical protein
MKTKTCKFRWLLAAMLVIYQIGLSQNYLRSPQEVHGEFKAYVNNLFQHIDKSKITSGLLVDYALEWVEIAPYNGVPFQH